MISEAHFSLGIFLYDDGRMPHGIRRSIGNDLIDPVAIRKGELFGESSRMFLHQDRFQMIHRSEWSMEIDRTCGDDGKFLVEVLHESQKESISFLHGADILESEFFDQTILQGLVCLFDSSFGLGTVGEDEFDSELFHSSAKLRFSVTVFHPSRQRFGGIHPKHAMPVNVKRQRFAVVFQVLLRCGKICIGGFTFGKRQMEEFASRIVDVNQQRTGWSPILKPMVR